MAEWSQLPKELLEEILTRLNSPIYAVRFRSVCTTWRQSIPAQTQSDGHGFSHVSNGLSLFKRSILLLSPPTTSDSQVPNNLNSWVIKIEQKNPKIFNLFYPLSRTQIKPLPPTFPKVLDLCNVRILELGHEYVLRYTNKHCFRGDFLNLYMEKVAFLTRKNVDDFLLLTIHVSGKLALFTNVNKQWHVVNDDFHFQSPYDDVIAFNGEFYAVDNTGRTVMVGVDSVESVVMVAKSVCGGDRKRLVEMGGELMLVDVYMGLPPLDNIVDGLDDFVASRSMWFKVFRLDWEGKNWVEVKNLGNCVLFLGVCSAFSASAIDLSWHKGNYICFAFPANFLPSIGDEDDDVLKYHCGGVFNLEDSSISYSKLFWPPPPWITSSS